MERRILYATLLSFIVLFAYQTLFVKPKPPATEQAANAAANGAQTANAPAAAAAGPAPQTASATATPGDQVAALVADQSARDVRVETRDVIAVFTNRGAKLKSWRLKRYFDHDRQPQELIEPLPNQPQPFTLQTADDAVNSALNNALFSVSGAPSEPITSAVDLKFEYRDSSGLSAVKTFHLEPSFYVFEFQQSVSKNDRVLPATILWGPAMGDATTGSSYSQKPQGLIEEGSKVQRLSAKDITKQGTYQGDYRYAGVDDNYFMSVALSPGPATIAYHTLAVPGPNPKDPARDFVAYSLDAPAAASGRLKFFVGPKDFDVLAQIGPDMTRAINFGMFSVIVVPLLRSLKWVNSYVGNYGWSIVVLTIIIQIILFPLQHKSIVSMRKMQEIQPQVKAIQDRYAKYKATDPEKQKMNQEMMALYRERGVNPASGCVPIMLTMPLLLAMWAMLQTSIELRGAPFLWIHDLTVRDPFYVAPVLMGLTQFWQQRITPAVGGDPAQQKMMMVMPAVMTVMFITLPAGALVYYTVSNLLRIGQQYITNSIIGPPNIKAARPAAERRVKRVGGGKTDAASEKP